MSDFNNDNFNQQNNNQDDSNGSAYSYTSPVTSDASDKKPKKKKPFFLKAIAFVVCMAFVGAGSIECYKYAEKNPKLSVLEDISNSSKKDSKTADSQSSSDESQSTSASSDSSSSKSSTKKKDLPSIIDLASRDSTKTVPEIVDDVMPSVVGVSATFDYTGGSSSSSPFDDNNNNNNEFGFGFGDGFSNQSPSQSQSQEIKGTGTGIVMTKDGYIVTNAHVIYDDQYNCGEAVDVSVVFSDQKEEAAKVVAYDTESDIAVLKVDATDLKPATFGNSDDLVVGELVIAIGNPLGFELFGSVTSGIVSALNREITVNEKKMNLIQTDAAINSGNSGGPLLNSSGQVIGINSAKMSSSYSSSASVEGLGFAIPISEAQPIIDDLINYGYVTGRPQIGISGRDVSDAISTYYNIPLGVYVMSVEKGSSAEWAGIKVGDVIIAIQDKPIKSIDEINEIKNQYKAGDTIKLTLSRSGEDKDIDVSLVLQELHQNANDSSKSSNDKTNKNDSSSKDDKTQPTTTTSDKKSSSER